MVSDMNDKYATYTIYICVCVCVYVCIYLQYTLQRIFLPVLICVLYIYLIMNFVYLYLYLSIGVLRTLPQGGIHIVCDCDSSWILILWKIAVATVSIIKNKKLFFNGNNGWSS